MFLIFYIIDVLTLCFYILCFEDIKSMEDIWNYVANQKLWMDSEYALYFSFLKIAIFCFDDSFANSWPSLNQLHEEVTWNVFHFAGVPCQG